MVPSELDPPGPDRVGTNSGRSWHTPKQASDAKSRFSNQNQGKGRLTPGGIRQGRPSIRGSSRLSPRTPVDAPGGLPPQLSGNPAPSASTRAGKRILFVCIGNSCRSQMAEAFARAYGDPWMEIASAGTAPADIVQPMTLQVLADRGVSAQGQFAKPLEMFSREHVDIVINLTGKPLELTGPLAEAEVIPWVVQDPIGLTPQVYRAVCTQIEDLVMRLLVRLRQRAKSDSK